MYKSCTLEGTTPRVMVRFGTPFESLLFLPSRNVTSVCARTRACVRALVLVIKSMCTEVNYWLAQLSRSVDNSATQTWHLAHDMADTELLRFQKVLQQWVRERGRQRKREREKQRWWVKSFKRASGCSCLTWLNNHHPDGGQNGAWCQVESWMSAILRFRIWVVGAAHIAWRIVVGLRCFRENGDEGGKGEAVFFWSAVWSWADVHANWWFN